MQIDVHYKMPLEDNDAEFIYIYKKKLACEMRRQGFKFRPVCKDATKETLTRCDYDLSVEIVNRHVTITVGL